VLLRTNRAFLTAGPFRRVTYEKRRGQKQRPQYQIRSPPVDDVNNLWHYHRCWRALASTVFRSVGTSIHIARIHMYFWLVDFAPSGYEPEGAVSTERIRRLMEFKCSEEPSVACLLRTTGASNRSKPASRTSPSNRPPLSPGPRSPVLPGFAA